MTEKLHEAHINRTLEESIRGAELNDAYQARYLHRIFKWMLTEWEGPDGRWWLTDYGKKLIAEMHDKLSQCPEKGDGVTTCVLDAVMLTLTRGDKRHLGNVLRDLTIACKVLAEQMIQEQHGKPIGVTQA